MKKYEQRSSPIASADPCRQATIVGMYEVEPNDGSSYRHFYLATDVEPLLKAAKAVCDYDWSDNDEDAVRAIEKLRSLMER